MILPTLSETSCSTSRVPTLLFTITLLSHTPNKSSILLLRAVCSHTPGETQRGLTRPVLSSGANRIRPPWHHRCVTSTTSRLPSPTIPFYSPPRPDQIRSLIIRFLFFSHQYSHSCIPYRAPRSPVQPQLQQWWTVSSSAMGRATPRSLLLATLRL